LPSKAATRPVRVASFSSPWFAEFDCPATTKTSPMPIDSTWDRAITTPPSEARTSSRNQAPAGASSVARKRSCSKFAASFRQSPSPSRAASYRGASWDYRRAPSEGEFRGDSHRATADGDSFTFTFEGTDISLISSTGPDRGTVEILIDGTPQGSIDLSKGQGSFQTVFTKQGLPRGKHVLTGIKRGGAVMSVDAFQVSDLINDADPELMFDTTTRHDARSAALEGSWEPRGSSWINGQRFTFTFHGTAVEVQGGAAHGSGDLVLTLNGQPHATVHCHGGQTTRTLASIGGLPNQSHTLVGHYTNPHPAGFISALDGFVVTRPDYWSREGGRGLGECGDDAHLSTLKGGTGHLAFEGSGVEIYTTRDAESRTAHYTLDGGGSSLWVGLNHYSPVTIPGAAVFRAPHLAPGQYTVRFINAANPAGVNFSSVRLAIDAVRVHKGESSSASPLFWGADGRGGSGVWDGGANAHWHDGAAALTWQDFGAVDHLAVFAGKGGTIDVAAPVRAHRLVFRSDGYTLRGQPLELTGRKPGFHVADAVRVVLALPVRLPGGTPLAAGSYTAASHPDLVTGGGTVVVESPRCGRSRFPRAGKREMSIRRPDAGFPARDALEAGNEASGKLPVPPRKPA
jgi:hypothetical protein